MVKVVSLKFQHYLVAFNMLLVEGSPKTGLFRDLPNHIFDSPHFWKCRSYVGHLIFESVQN